MTVTEILPVIWTIVLIVLGLVLIVVGVQLFITLGSLRGTIKRVNGYLDEVDEKIEMLTYPLRIISSFLTGFGSGTKAMSSFSSWLKGDTESGAKK
jgi:hypothetical protein